MSDFGKCQKKGCQAIAVVGFNGHYFCLVHFDEGLVMVRKAAESGFNRETTT
jgi:hypothetical protein